MKLPTSSELLILLQGASFTAPDDFKQSIRGKSRGQLVEDIIELAGQMQTVVKMLDLYHDERRPITWIKHRIKDIKLWASHTKRTAV